MGRTHITERDGAGTITVSPRNEADQSALVVICHGLGDTAEGFADVAEQFAESMPHLKIVLPTAPTQKVTMNMGMAMPSWYDIVGLDERSNENCYGIEESSARVVSILQKEHEEKGLPYSR
jgi:lysophospholipase-2